MKTSQKIRCQPITTKKRASKKGLVKTELEIPSFPSFQFWPYTEIENSENSEIFSRLLNFKGFVLFEKVGNFRGFRVFDFGPYTEIENSENSEIFSILLNLNKFLLYEKNWEFPRFPNFQFWPLSWNRKLGKLGNSQIPQRKQILWNLCLEKISEFSEFPILV